MKRSRLFLVGAITAALTYGSLIAIIGPRQWGYHGYYHHGWHHHHDHDAHYDKHQKSEPGTDESWNQKPN